MLGGTGHFGARICRRLARRDGTHLVISSRSQSRAQAFVDTLDRRGPGAVITAAAVDLSGEDLGSVLSAIGPDVVIHTAGPYQGQDYRVAEACIACGCHYVDLADGREFVAGIAALNGAAQAAGVAVVAGASTLPALSAAVVAECGTEMESIESVETCIAPAHRTPRGLGTVRAVLSYCGRPFNALEDGAPRRLYGWQDMHWVRVRGLLPRLAAACDVPDFDVLPRRYESIRRVQFHAALAAPWEHVALWLMAWMTRMGLVRDWSRHGKVFAAVSRALSLVGSSTGGMRVRVRGTDASQRPIEKQWTLIAGQNHGPEIPCTPSIIVADKLLAGEQIPVGAMACTDLFSLDEFMREMDEFDLTQTMSSRA